MVQMYESRKGEWILFGVFMILLIAIVGCGDEKFAPDQSLTEGEKEFYEDYESPRLKWGFINSDGKFSVLPRFDDVRDFQEGLALVNFKGKWGMIDTNDKRVIDFKYRDLHPFKEGLALAEDFEQNRYYINMQGDSLFGCEYATCYDFNDGLARVEEGEYITFIDKKGQSRNDLIFSSASDFNSGYSIVRKGAKAGIIDTTGKHIIPLSYDRITIREGIALLLKDEIYTFIDLKSGKSFKNNYEKAKPFEDGLAVVIFDGQSGIIDTQENFTPIAHEGSLRYLGEQRWGVRNNNGFFIIKRDGSKINDQYYKSLFKYNCGIIGIEQASGWGYVDLDGNEVIPPELPIIWDCQGGLVRFIARSGYGFMTPSSTVQIAPKFFEARDFIEGKARAATFPQ